MPISNRFVIVCYNIIHCIVFNFVIIIFAHIYIFTNSLFLFMLPRFTPPPPPPTPIAYLILPNVPTTPTPFTRTPRLFGTQDYVRR